MTTCIDTPALAPVSSADIEKFLARLQELSTPLHEVNAIYCHPSDLAWAQAIHATIEPPLSPVLLSSTMIERGKLIGAHYNRQSGLPEPRVLLEREVAP